MKSNMSEYCAPLQPRSMAKNFDVLKLCKKGRKEFNGSFYICFAVAKILILVSIKVGRKKTAHTPSHLGRSQTAPNDLRKIGSPVVGYL